MQRLLSLKPSIGFQVIDSLPSALLIVDANGNVFYCNKRFEQIVDMPLSKLAGKPIASLPWTTPSGLQHHIKQRIIHEDYELPYLTTSISPGNPSNGNKKRYHVMFLSTIHHEEQTYLPISFEDLSEHDELKDIVSYLNEYNESIIESSQMGVLVTDRMGTITKINKAHELITGKSKEETLGKTLYVDYASQADNRLQDAFHEVIEHGKTFVFRNYKYISSRKGVVYLDIRMTPLEHPSEGILGMVELIDDVSKEFRLERELRKQKRGLEEKINELHVSYLELGKVNRQLASLIDIERLMAGDGQWKSNLSQLLKSLISMTGAHLCAIRAWDENDQSFAYLFEMHASPSRPPDSVQHLDPLFDEISAQKTHFHTVNARELPNEFVSLPKAFRQQYSCYASLPLLTSYRQAPPSSLVLFSQNDWKLSNLDVDLIKAIAHRIQLLLYISYLQHEARQVAA
jgi:PAS domain S-box-containing protein